MDINFELYKIFYHCAKHRSFSQAAQALFISQSAVSQAVKNLEEKIGDRLFVRNHKNIQLSAEGEILFQHVEQAFNFIKTGEAKVAELQNMEAGEVRIGVGDTICKYFLIPVLERFYSRYPKVKIQVVNRTSSQILDHLRKGIIDLGIVTLPVRDKNISVMEFISVEDIFVAGGKSIHIQKQPLTLSELAAYPLLMLPQDSATRRNFDDFLERENLRITPEIELESIDLLIEFAKIGLGIAHVLKESARDALDKGELFQIPIVEKLPPRKLGIAFMNHVPLSKTASAFASFLR